MGFLRLICPAGSWELRDQQVASGSRQEHLKLEEGTAWALNLLFCICVLIMTVEKYMVFPHLSLGFIVSALGIVPACECAL